ncbi:MAG TPA: hypothetical protein PLM51_04655 [Bacillota bacterium]|nr:hypothetical protein [Bacillota bacterium]
MEIILEKVGNWFSETIGITISSETSVLTGYFFVVETVAGEGKTSGSGKPVNITFGGPEEFWKFWEYSIGLDVNINGKGVGLYFGGEMGVSFTDGNQAFDISVNSLGRISFKSTTFDDYGNYSYFKADINRLEIAALVLVAIYAPELIPIFTPLIPALSW